MKLRIACLQFNPVIGKVEQNVSQIKKLLSKANKKIDLLVLPELSITGYNFHSPKEIEPYLEQQGKGRSFDVANELSNTYKCTTVIGYPETWNGTTYNSAMVVDRAGKLVSNYRKTHLYETDEVWGCSENPDASFSAVMLRFPAEKGNSFDVPTNLGICMDLNPKQFKAPFNRFEFSMKVWKDDSSLIIVPTAWISPDSPGVQDHLNSSEKQSLTHLYKDFVTSQQNQQNQQKQQQQQQKTSQSHNDVLKNEVIGDSKASKEPSSVQGIFQKSDFVTNPTKRSDSIINYWILRFFPFLSHPFNSLPKKNHKTTVVLCNRSGIEDDVVYGGSSCIIQFDPSSSGTSAQDIDNPSVKVLASAGQVTEEVIYHEVKL